MIERQPDGQLLHLGIDHLIQSRESVRDMIDKMAQEEIDLMGRLERVVATKLYFIQEDAKLTERIKIGESAQKET